MFDIMIERQQVLKIKVVQVEHLEDGGILRHIPYFLYLSLGSRGCSHEGYYYDVQLLKYKKHFGISTLFSGFICFSNIPELISKTLKEHTKSFNQSIEVVPTNGSFTIINLTDIQKIKEQNHERSRKKSFRHSGLV